MSFKSVGFVFRLFVLILPQLQHSFGRRTTPTAAVFSQLDPMADQAEPAMLDPIAASYTNREYVGVECLWLEAVTLLLLSIGILNACLEAKKLKESCAGVIGAMVLAIFGIAAAVVIRLPCVPLQPNYDGLMQVRRRQRPPLSTRAPTGCRPIFSHHRRMGRVNWIE